MKASKAKKIRHSASSKEDAISEAYRYLKNAKETISKSSIELGIRYTDSKYVREAAGIAYLASLLAIDGYLLGRGETSANLPNSIEEYFTVLEKIPSNKRLKASLHVVYENLHILAYYRGGVGVEMVKEGFQRAKDIVEELENKK